MAAALGVALEPGQVAMSIGPSGTVYTVSDEPTADPKGYVAGFADATGRFLPLACTLNAMRVIDTFARVLQVDLTGFDQLALAGEPGAGGRTLLSPLNGGPPPSLPHANRPDGRPRARANPRQSRRRAVASA